MMISDIFPIEKPVLALVGPTAIGKTELSLSLASEYNCEIISLDSMQVHRFMDIGTAKATKDERQRVNHHLIDIIDPDELYDASRYVSDALAVISDIHLRKKIPLLTGGTGLYLRSLIDGLFEDVGHFPELRKQLSDRLEKEGSSKLHEELSVIDSISALKIHVNDTHRLLRALEIFHGTGSTWSEYLEKQTELKANKRFTKVNILGLTCDRTQLYKRINTRTARMFEEGLKEEVISLLDKGYNRELKSMQSIGYRQMVAHLLDNVSHEETTRLIARDTRRYAKRQYTWFKKMKVEWHEVARGQDISKRIGDFLM